MRQSKEPNREELKEHWRQRVKAASADYEKARNAALNALSVLRNNESPGGDGLVTLKQAACLETTSLQRYMQVLRILHDLVVLDRMPPEE
jgi:hypothetical protein